MFDYRVAGRYAKSLIDLAVEKKQLEQVREDMIYLESVCSFSEDFLFVIKNPLINKEAKKKAVSAVCGKNVNTLVMAFLHLLIDKNRENYLPQIIKAFLRQYDAIMQRHKVTLITAVPVSDSIKKNFLNKLHSEAKIENIQLNCFVNGDLIGGFILEYDGKRMDASLQNGLTNLQTKFEKVRISADAFSLPSIEKEVKK